MTHQNPCQLEYSYHELIQEKTIARMKLYRVLGRYVQPNSEANRINPEKDPKKRIRQDVRYAVKSGKLLMNWDVFDTKDALAWAARQYPEFGQALKIPLSLFTSGNDFCHVPAPKCRQMENPPDDQLREAFKEKCREVFALEDRIEELEARLVEWRRDAEMWRRQKNGWIKEEETNQCAERQDEKEQP